jgi:hypothetical protein
MPIRAGKLKIWPSNLHFRTETRPGKRESVIKNLVGDYIISPNFGSQKEILDMATKGPWSGNFSIKCLERPKEPAWPKHSALQELSSSAMGSQIM